MRSRSPTRSRTRSAAAAPVVALETTLVAHGFPPGEGVAVGLEAERRVRDGGRRAGDDRRARRRASASGSTRGRARALRRRRRARSGRATSRPASCRARSARRRSAARSPSAARPGIRFMATGGLGGVHRGWAEQPDVSADLGELARTQALVVSSGVKSLLDVPATAEAARDARRARCSASAPTSCRSSTRRAAGRPSRRASRAPRRRPRSRARTGSSAARGARCSRGRRTRASTTSSR